MNIHKLWSKKGVVLATLLTPGRCPQWGRHTPDVPGRTPGRLVCRKGINIDHMAATRPQPPTVLLLVIIDFTQACYGFNEGRTAGHGQKSRYVSN